MILSIIQTSRGSISKFRHDFIYIEYIQWRLGIIIYIPHRHDGPQTWILNLFIGKTLNQTSVYYHWNEPTLNLIYSHCEIIKNLKICQIDNAETPLEDSWLLLDTAACKIAFCGRQKLRQFRRWLFVTSLIWTLAVLIKAVSSRYSVNSRKACLTFYHVGKNSKLGFWMIGLPTVYIENRGLWILWLNSHPGWYSSRVNCCSSLCKPDPVLQSVHLYFTIHTLHSLHHWHYSIDIRIILAKYAKFIKVHLDLVYL